MISHRQIRLTEKNTARTNAAKVRAEKPPGCDAWRLNADSLFMFSAKFFRVARLSSS